MWNPLLSDFEKSMKYGGANLVDVYKVMRALATMNILKDEVASEMVNYVVKRGYDAEDMVAMAGEHEINSMRRAVHLIMLVSYSKPDIKNKHFLNSIEVFTREVIDKKTLNPMEAFELYKALYNLKNFKSDKLLKALRKTSFSNLLGQDVSE